MSRIENPIIPGFYPDPSICRVGNDYYLANSSFELFPGIPLFHSTDLMHFEQICNVMTEENHFHVERSYGGGGMMAPTIRWHDGTFYIICCNFADKGNFIVTAEDPRGPWSEPHWLDDVPGIDASIFFDDDGKCYVMGTGDDIDEARGIHERAIWAAEYDIENFRMAGEPVIIFHSAMRGAESPEAPHIYHIGDYYYLLIAEGGTDQMHSVVVGRSREVLSFYENNPANPVMTHRMMGTHAEITNTGHADLVQTQNGDWYAVMLASRNIDGKHKVLGRETYICPVEWEYDWPLFSPETGHVEFEYEGTGLEEECEDGESGDVCGAGGSSDVSDAGESGDIRGAGEPEISSSVSELAKAVSKTAEMLLSGFEKSEFSKMFSEATEALMSGDEQYNPFEDFYQGIGEKDEFDSPELSMDWTFWGTPYGPYYEIKDSQLHIRCVPQSLAEPIQPVSFGFEGLHKDRFAPFIAKRQREFVFSAACRMNFLPKGGESAGMALVQQMNNQYHFEFIAEEGQTYLRVVLVNEIFSSRPYLPGFTSSTKREIVARVPWDKDSVVLKINGNGRDLGFFYGDDEDSLTELCKGDTTLISTEQIGCMTGTMIGLFASGNGEDVDNKACFDWFELEQVRV